MIKQQIPLVLFTFAGCFQKHFVLYFLLFKFYNEPLKTWMSWCKTKGWYASLQWNVTSEIFGGKRLQNQQ